MAKTFLESINTKDPNFLREYEGKYIQAPEGFYEVKNGKVSLVDYDTLNNQWLQSRGLKKGDYGSGGFGQQFSQNSVGFDPVNGLQPWGKGEYKTSEAFRYFNNGAIPQEQISSNFGMGSGFNFRPRGANEDMASYLRERQAAEIASRGTSGIDIRTPQQTGRQIYRIGQDIYNASNNQKIGSTEWKRDWSGKPDVTEVKTATLYGPDGQKQVVGIGSQYASSLQSQGWGLTVGSYNPQGGLTGGSTGGSAGGSTSGSTDGSTGGSTGENSEAGTQPMTGLSDADRSRIKNLLDTQYPNLTATERQFLEATFLNSDNYTSGKTIPTNAQISQWISDAATNAATDINPYYQRISKEELDSYKQSMADIRAKSQTFQANEENTYAQKLADTKQKLRARGLTFSGSAIRNIGQEAAGGAPSNYEGTLQASRRLDYEGNLQDLSQKARQISTEAERRLGSDVIGGALNEVGSLSAPSDLSGRLSTNLYTPIGTYRGTGSMAPTIEQDRAKAIEESKQQRLNQYRLTL